MNSSTICVVFLQGQPRSVHVSDGQVDPNLPVDSESYGCTRKIHVGSVGATIPIDRRNYKQLRPVGAATSDLVPANNCEACIPFGYVQGISSVPLMLMVKIESYAIGSAFGRGLV